MHFFLFLISLAIPSLALISDDFENGWDQTVWPIYAPDCNQGGAIRLDTTTAHSGQNSMRVDGAGGYCGHMFFGTSNFSSSSSSPSSSLFVRVWLKTANPLTTSHVSFITMPDAAQGPNKHLRIGGQSTILMYNREVDDATLPDLSPQGIAASTTLAVDRWQCLEYHLENGGHVVETWLDSRPVEALTVGGAPNANADQWLRGVSPQVTGVYFGWESYGGDTNTFWYDDIAIAESRVGCD